MKRATKLLGTLSNVYTVLEETENLVRLSTKCSVTLEELQQLYDKGFRLINTNSSISSVHLTMEKPQTTTITR